jgi:hypothetical protein
MIRLPRAVVALALGLYSLAAVGGGGLVFCLCEDGSAGFEPRFAACCDAAAPAARSAPVGATLLAPAEASASGCGSCIDLPLAAVSRGGSTEERGSELRLFAPGAAAGRPLAGDASVPETGSRLGAAAGAPDPSPPPGRRHRILRC